MDRGRKFQTQKVNRLQTAKNPGRAINQSDWHFIKTALKRWSATGSFVGLRLHALVFLCAGTGLRVSEAVSLDLGQLLVNPDKVNAWEIKTRVFLRQDQIKGKREGAWFYIPEPAKIPLKNYIRACRKLGYINFPLKHTPLFFAHKTTGLGKNGERLSKRSAQNDFKNVQKMAAITDTYRFHDLRHTHQTNMRKSGCTDPYKIAAASRLRSIEMTMRYNHTDAEEIEKAVEKSAELL